MHAVVNLGRGALALLAMLCVAGPAVGADVPANTAAAKAEARDAKLLQLFVAAPYLDLRTGPGRGYPVTQVVARGESLDVIFRRTDYFKVRTARGVEGKGYSACLFCNLVSPEGGQELVDETVRILNTLHAETATP